jgi:hypothetical protein
MGTMEVNQLGFALIAVRKKALSDFGFRNMGNGKIRNQSWCKDCRGNCR